jgi:hypothetical protein
MPPPPLKPEVPTIPLFAPGCGGMLMLGRPDILKVEAEDPIAMASAGRFIPILDPVSMLEKLGILALPLDTRGFCKAEKPLMSGNSE